MTDPQSPLASIAPILVPVPRKVKSMDRIPSFLLLALATALPLAAPAQADPPAQPPAAPAPQQPAAPAPAPAPAPTLTVTVPTYINTTCPIMAKPASKAMFAETARGRIYVCCLPCIPRILKDPDKALEAAYPTIKKAGNTKCPVTDQALGADAVTVVLQGYEIGVCKTCAEEATRPARSPASRWRPTRSA
jgi:hypothetical protein